MAIAGDNVASDLAHAIVLAGVRHQETLTKFEEGIKRKSRWSECKVAKKGKRWGMPDDKPYKPLCYVDLPMGLTEKEIDQFLREQRLEDLHRKIQSHELEDHDPDIRPPSPPPVYDKSGARVNTRDIRIRKSMTSEYNRLIRYMIKNVEGYLPPIDWKPAKLLKKIIIPIEKFPQAPFMGVIIGPRGVNHKRLQDTTGCKIFIRGRDIGDKWQSDEEASMPQHVHIEGETEEQIVAAERLIEPLLNPESPEFEYARTHGMQQLAMVSGFSLNKAEQRCGICGALGHLGFECPETNNQNYKMANVVCTICGDRGHVAADCKKAAEANKRENVDWKQQAERKAEMEKNFGDMMNDIGNMDMNMQGGNMTNNPPPAGTPATQGNVMGTQNVMMNQNPMAPRPAGVPMPGAAGSGVDKTISCPGQLVGKLIGPAGATIKKIAMDTGAQINLDQTVQPNGGKAVVISAADPAVRERARAVISQWIKDNSAPPSSMPRPVGMVPPPASGHLRPVAPLNVRPSMGGPPNFAMPQQRPPVAPGGVPHLRPPAGMMPPTMRPPAYGNMPGNMPQGGNMCQGGNMPPGPGMRPSFGGNMPPPPAANMGQGFPPGTQFPPGAQFPPKSSSGLRPPGVSNQGNW